MRVVFLSYSVSLCVRVRACGRARARLSVVWYLRYGVWYERNVLPFPDRGIMICCLPRESSASSRTRAIVKAPRFWSPSPRYSRDLQFLLAGAWVSRAVATFGDVSSAVTPDSGFPPGHGGKVVGSISVSVKIQTSLLFSPITNNCNCRTGLYLSSRKNIEHFKSLGRLLHFALKCIETLLSWTEEWGSVSKLAALASVGG